MNGLDPELRRQRALARRERLQGRVYRGEPPPPARLSTPEERLAAMWPLALDAWAMTGRPLPEYSREEMPGKVIRP